MKIKDGCEATTADFWYDLTRGGYLRPGDILENPVDVQRVNDAVAVLVEFESACEAQIDGFMR